MAGLSYLERRSAIETYFDRTAVEAWARLTSDAPLGRIRASVRAGRDSMRQTLLSWLPDDLSGLRLLDAGCGSGAFAVEAARRGATVVAIDLSPTLIELARERTPQGLGRGKVEFIAGDMLDPHLGAFDHVVGMDCLIHYPQAQMVQALGELGARTRASMLFTFAPRTPALAIMHAVGRLFPRKDRAPAISPLAETALRRVIAADPGLADWRAGRTQRVTNGFYVSQAQELRRT
ncbi:magnesium protoporphyrin O-methyltransferase [Methylocella silvestris BL2]|uniref:Magnesium protoporphyrin IX methyltransferase n=1 Tax=Methylocella silvestris (strain DSM 15510 / CIP 108128 / LMG 27833 / NCIMB 13906 / BL2) TaxID=395965 RepID=B8EPX4_METSB|nr:magnesium protoporphyrin IX methyltransferase [Methylocella silvestris]ACK50978.1 magnesium protoporphyrin O-methyltransferase [Methylocella silvestris BL2]